MPRHTVTIFSEGQEKAFEAPTAYIQYVEGVRMPTTKKAKKAPGWVLSLRLRNFSSRGIARQKRMLG